MVDQDAVRRFLEEYRRYVTDTLEPAFSKTKAILSSWKDPSHWSRYRASERSPSPSPIQRVRVRIKRPESVLDKILRRPYDYPAGLRPESFASMTDTFGARIVVFFAADLSLIDRQIRTSGDFQPAPHYPPVAYLNNDLHEELGLTHLARQPKASGYASIRYILRLSMPVAGDGDAPWFELQVRPLLEDVWGEIEHLLGYGTTQKTSRTLRKQFRLISRSLEAIDDHCNMVYEDIARQQVNVSYNDSDPLSAENLPSVLNELGVASAQAELTGLLKILSSRGIQTVGGLRATQAQRNGESAFDVAAAIPFQQEDTLDEVSAPAVTNALRVFLCHASPDKPKVRELYQKLTAEGFDVWLDEETLLPGQDWQEEIPRAVKTSHVVLVCLSRTAVTKVGYLQREIRFALDVADEQPEGSIFLIPLKLEDCDIPTRLSRWQWVNVDMDGGYVKLMRSLRRRAEELGLKAVP